MAPCIPVLWRVLAVATLVNLVAAQAPATPGIRAAISQGAIDKIKALVLAAVVPALDNVSVPFFYIDQDTISMNMSDIKLSSVALSGVTATLSPGVGIVAAVGSLDCVVNADFYVRSDVWPNPSGSGTAVVTVSGATAALTVAVGASALHVTLSAEGVSASAGALDIQLSGNGITWALNLLKGVITKVIQSVIASKVPEVITKIIDVNVTRALARIPTSAALPLPAPLNISTLLVGVTDAGVTAQYIGLDLQGAVVDTRDPQPAPFQPPDLPPYDAALGAQELQLLLSPYAIESALWVYWDAGLLQARVKSPLGTAALALIAPDIGQYYPKDTTVELSLNLTVPVDVIMSDSPAGAFAIATADVAFLPLNGSQPPPVAFVITAQATADLDLFVNTTTVNGTLRQAIAASISGVSVALAVAESNVGPVHVALAQTLITALLTDALVPLLDAVLRAGLPIPALDGLALANTTIAFGSGYSLLATDVVPAPGWGGARLT